MKKKLLTLPKAAELFSVSRYTLWGYVKSGELKTTKTPGGHHRVSREALEVFAGQKGVDLTYRESRICQKVLVVDDELPVQKLVRRFLVEDGYEIQCASDGFEAGQLSVKFKPDLYILDIFMPRLNGFEVCERLRADPDTKDVKIIAISGFGNDKNIKKILASGADLFIPKPIEHKTVVEGVRTLFGKGYKGAT